MVTDLAAELTILIVYLRMHMTLGYVQHRCMKLESLLVIGFFIVLVTVSLLLHAALHLQFRGYMPW